MLSQLLSVVSVICSCFFVKHNLPSSTLQVSANTCRYTCRDPQVYLQVISVPVTGNFNTCLTGIPVGTCDLQVFDLQVQVPVDR